MTSTLTRRNFLRLAAASTAGLALYSGEFERHQLEVTRLNIAVPRLPDAFHGFTIAQVSDIHFQEYTEAFFLRHVIRTVNTLNADLVALTGDYVTDGPFPTSYAQKRIGPCVEMLAQLQSPLRYAILGNHDALVDAPGITNALEAQNIPVLANRSVPIERSGQRIWLAGIEDACIQRPDLNAAIPRPNIRQNDLVILLGHEPDFADIVVKHQVDLMLSGHTHGGQIRIPFTRPHFLPDLGDKYVEGLFSIGPMRLYVNRGIGTVGIPFRFRCPPEVTLITLTKKHEG
jgi:uncharacterized protein